MLNFSKINIISIYIIFLFVSIFSFLNLQDKNNPLINKKVNLGLDLQGGSYLLLEINSDSLVEEKMQAKVIPIKKLNNVLIVMITKKQKMTNDSKFIFLTLFL